jgi:hypothetical protein
MRGMVNVLEPQEERARHPAPRASVPRDPRLLVGLGLALLVCATNRWMSWSGGIDYLTARDVGDYETIARAAPGLPSTDMPAHHAARFPVHWALGTVSALSGIPLHTTYRLALAAVVVLTLVVLHATLAPRLGPGAYAVVLAVFVLNPYALRYDMLVPGMVADATFVLGITLALFGLIRHRAWAVVAGMALAATARETALVVAPVVAVWVLLAPGWRATPGRSRAALAGGVVVLVAGIVVTCGAVAKGFSAPALPGVFDSRAAVRGYSLPRVSPATVDDYTVIGALASPRVLAEHVVRVATPLLIVLTLVLAAGAQFHRERRGLRGLGPELWGALAIGAAIVVQPLLVSPAVLADNETRLAALSLVPLAVALSLTLERLGANRLTWRDAGVVAAVLAIGSLHHLYTVVGPSSAPQMPVLELAAGVAAGYVVVRAFRRRSVVPAARGGAPPGS